MNVGEWVHLLRTPEEKALKSRPRVSNGCGGRRTVKVLENTPRPQGKVGVKKSKRPEVQVLRSQVASLVKEKRDLALTVGRGTVN